MEKLEDGGGTSSRVPFEVDHDLVADAKFCQGSDDGPSDYIAVRENGLYMKSFEKA